MRYSVFNLFACYIKQILKQVQNYIVVCILVLVFFSIGLRTFAKSMTSSCRRIIQPQVSLKFKDIKPVSSLIRVAIRDNNFKSLVYNEISIIATSGYSAYDKRTAKPLAKFELGTVLKVKLKKGITELYVNNRIVARDNGVIVLDSSKGLLGVKNLKRNGKQVFYHGVFEITPKNNYTFYLINVLDLDSYLKGVVPNEMPVRFGLEALKAQAIAARNYARTPRKRSHKEFDVDDSVASQVYFGANTEKALSSKAVDETQGLFALYGWDLILAQYSSTAGGYTENFENVFSDSETKQFPSTSKPYLKGRPDIYSVGALNREEEARLFYMSYPDSYDIKSPYYRWQKKWNVEELHDVLAKTLIYQSKTGFINPEFKVGDTLGKLKELRVKRRGVSGKIMELEIVTDKTIYTVRKELVIRRLLQKNGVSLPSANVVFENLYDKNKKLNKIIAYGGGYGHGVGMSQYGAGFMSMSLHKTFDEILKRYYTGITISTCPVILSSSESQKISTQIFFAPYKKAILVIDNKYEVKGFDANINGREVKFELKNKIIPFDRVSRIDISNYVKCGKNKITFYYPERVDENNKAIRLYVELVKKDDN